jgi:hypothetical protein
MSNHNHSKKSHVTATPNPYVGSSLVPMLIGGLAMIVIGMIAVVAFS